MAVKKVNLMRTINPISVTYQICYAEPVLKTENAVKEADNLPKNLTIIYPGMDEAGEGTDMDSLWENCQLYIGNTPAASDQWDYHADKRILQFTMPEVSGHFELIRNAHENHGLIVCNGHAFAATIILAPLTYELDIAEGAAYIVNQGNQPTLVYDESSSMWKDAWAAKKLEKALRITYQLESTPVVGQQVMTLTMQFTSPDEDIWEPDASSYSAWIDGDFNICFQLNLNETTDPGYEFYPYQLVGKLDPFGQIMTGAILTGERSARGTAYGVVGRYVDENTVCGTYQMHTDGTMFSVLGGKLHIRNREISDSHVEGTMLRWNFTGNEKREEFEQVLPAEGVLHFTEDASAIVEGAVLGGLLRNRNARAVIGQRISADEALALNPCKQTVCLRAAQDSHPSYTELLAMTPYKINSQGQLVDEIQDKSMNSFMTLLQHYIPEDLYKQFINMNIDDIPSELRGIFEMKGDDGSDPQKMYAPYTSAYLTSILSTAKEDEFAGKLNRVRADKYLYHKLRDNKIFQKQAPLIYKQEFMKAYPKLQEFLDDQRNDKTNYAGLIAEDCAKWKEDAAKSFGSSEDDIKALNEYQAHIDMIAKEAMEEGKYWPYFLLRYSMTPTFLSALQNASLSGISSASLITQKVQQITALLTVLDDKQNSVFVQEFVKSVQIFQISNVLPVLFDLSGNHSLADYSYATEKILREFAEKYADSADETLKNYAKYIRSLSAEDFGKLYNCMVYAYNSLDGIFVYNKFVSNFDKWYQKLFGKIPELAAYGCILGAFTTGISMFVSGQISWKDLSTAQQVKLIGTGAGLFAMIAVKITQRAMLVNMLKPTTGLMKRIGIFFWFSKENKIAALTDSYLINSSFKQWFIGEAGLGREGLETAAEAARILGFREGESEGVLVKIFGRNLDTAIARGLGIAFAIAGIVMSAIDLDKGGSDMTKATNALFLASSCLDLIAAGAGIAGLEIASSVFGVIGIAAAVAGFILMMIEVTKKQPTPIETFAKDYASKMGFYMPDGFDIDSFEIVPPSGDVPSLTGINLYTGSADRSVIFNSDNTVSIGAFDGEASNCLGLDVDEVGNVRFYTYLENEEQKKIPLYLTHCADGTIKALQLIADITDKSQIWKCETAGSATRDKYEHLVAASFKVGDGEGKYLCLNTAGTGLTLSNSPVVWTVEMKAAKAAGLCMADIALHTYDRDQQFIPRLLVEGSNPKVYSIVPQLPDFMQFDVSNGIISQKKGVKPDITAKRSYTLSLKDALGKELPAVQFSFQVCEGGAV